MKVRLPYERSLKDAKRDMFDAAVEAKSREKFKNYDSYAIDIVMAANLLALIEGDEKWGTGKRATRIPRHLATVEKIILEACDRYGHAFAFTALAKRLENHGVTYERKSKV